MYSLCALVGNTTAMALEIPIYQSAHRIELRGGVSMIPLGEALLAEVIRSGSAAPAPSVGGAFEFLAGGVEAWVKVMSVGSPIAFVETEYFGGEGFERAGVWRLGQIALGPLDGAGSINQALRAVGVKSPTENQEFEHVGLDRCRSVEEWLAHS